jgi:hypothetical protein
VLDFKLAIAAMVDILIRDAVERGHPTDGLFRRIGAESLELAARIHIQHGGCDPSFLGMAQDLLGVVRTGASEQ